MNEKNTSVQTVGIVCAMDSELTLLRDRIEGRREETLAATPFYSGSIDGVPVVVCGCGVGKANAAMHTQILIDRFAPDVILHNGVAGALGDGLNVYDVVIGSEFVYHDMQEFILRDFEPLELVYYADPALVRVVSALCPGARVGRIATGDLFVTEKGDKEAIREKTGALCVDMESAAIAHTAFLNGIRFAALRVISDQADEGAGISFAEFEKAAAAESAKRVLRFLRGLSRA